MGGTCAVAANPGFLRVPLSGYDQTIQITIVQLAVWPYNTLIATRSYMAKLATKWVNLPNASHIQRVLNYMLSSPAAWEDDWNKHSYYMNDAHFDATAKTRKTARGLNRRSEWNSAYTAAWAVEKRVHAALYAKFKEEYLQRKDGETAEGSHYFMFRHAVDAIAALVTYDDCAYMLDAASEDILKLAMTNNPAAVLLYPACVAFNKIK